MRKFNFIIVFLFLLNSVKSQNVGIGTTTPAAKLHVENGSVLFTGQDFPLNGPYTDPPLSWTGHRMMWYSPKAAFRAGGVLDANWDRDSIGLYSFAAGYDPRAKGNYSVAIGKGVIATNTGSVALGMETTVSGFGATAMGYQTTAMGSFSTAMGDHSSAIGNESTAIGAYVIAGNAGSLALGSSTYASGNNSTAMGYGTNASHTYSTAMGYMTTASGPYSTAIGDKTNASGIGSTTMGSSTIANGGYSLCTGYVNESSGYASFVTGLFNDPIVTAQSDISPTTPLFIVGNGSDYNNRNNAIVVRYDGNVGIGTNTPHAKLQISNGSAATYSDNSGYAVFGSVASSNLVFDNNEILARNNGGLANLHLQAIGGSVMIGAGSPDHLLDVNGTAGKPGSGSWATYSDARLKQNISPYTDGLSSLMKINPVRFRYNELSGYDAKPTYVGVIAQELQKVSPYMVSVSNKKMNNGATGYLEVDNSAMTYMLINAVKEQQKEIEELRKLNEIMSEKNQLMLKRIEIIETLNKKQ